MWSNSTVSLSFAAGFELLKLVNAFRSYSSSCFLTSASEGRVFHSFVKPKIKFKE